MLLLLAAYLTIRAFSVAIIMDEATTLYSFIMKDNWFPNSEDWNANNHMLNTLLGIYSTKVFGYSELALRLPNLIAGFLYLFYAYLWSKRVKETINAVTLFVGLAGSQFVLDFFGLSRGYGLSIAFTLVSWFHLSLWWRNRGAFNSLIAICAASIATWANLSMLLPQAVGLSIIFLGLAHDLLDRNPISKATLFWMILFGIIPSFLFAKVGFLLMDGGHLYYGQGSGFWEVTVDSLMKYALYLWDGKLKLLLPAGVMFSSVSVVVLWVKSGKWIWKNDASMFLLLILGCIVGHVSLHHLFGVNYPMDRVGLYLLPLSVLLIVWAREALLDIHPLGPLLSLALVSVVWILPINLLATLNTSYARVWKWEENSKQFFNQILTEYISSGVQPIVAASSLQEDAYNYYNMRANWPLASLQNEIRDSGIADFIYPLPDDPSVNWRFSTTVNQGNDSQSLFRRSPFRQRVLIESLETDSSTFTGEFFGLLNQNLDSLKGTDLLYELTLAFSADSIPMNIWLVMGVNDSIGDELMYKSYELKNYPRRWKLGENMITEHWVMPGRNVDADHVKIFIWNIDQKSMHIRKANLQVYKLTDT